MALLEAVATASLLHQSKFAAPVPPPAANSPSEVLFARLRSALLEGFELIYPPTRDLRLSRMAACGSQNVRTLTYAELVNERCGAFVSAERAISGAGSSKAPLSVSARMYQLSSHVKGQSAAMFPVQECLALAQLVVKKWDINNLHHCAVAGCQGRQLVVGRAGAAPALPSSSSSSGERGDLHGEDGGAEESQPCCGFVFLPCPNKGCGAVCSGV